MGVGFGAGGGAGAAAQATEHKRSKKAGQVVVAGAGGQAAYQLAGVGAKQVNDRVVKPRGEARSSLSREKRKKVWDAHRKEHGLRGTGHVQGAADRWTAAFRSYPKELPGWKAERALAHTHGGRSGLAVGTLATLAPAGLVASRKDKVGKAMYGVQERKTEPSRVIEAGVGGALAAYGLSRLKMVGSLARYGARVAERNGAKPKQVDRVMSAAAAVGRGTKQVTGGGESQLRRVKVLNNAIEQIPLALRPAVATTAGIMLVQHARPVRQDHFKPMGRY